MATGFVQRFKGKIVAFQVFMNGPFNVSVNQATVAPAGSTQAGAATLTKQEIQILGSASVGTSAVALRAAADLGIGGRQVLYGQGTVNYTVFGAVGTTDTIDGTAGSTGVTLTASHRCEYRVTSGSTFVSALLGATSS